MAKVETQMTESATVDKTRYKVTASSSPNKRSPQTNSASINGITITEIIRV